MAYSYAELKQKHREMIDRLPIRYADSEEQFKEMMAAWNLDSSTDTDKIFSVGYGWYMLKKDVGLLEDYLTESEKEIKEAIESDETGYGYVYQMFYKALSDSDFRNSLNPYPALDSIGITAEEVKSEPRFMNGFVKAVCDLLNIQTTF